MEGTRQQTSAVIATLIENRRRFLSFLTRRVCNPSDAEEILQTAFVKGKVSVTYGFRIGR